MPRLRDDDGGFQVTCDQCGYEGLPRMISADDAAAGFRQPEGTVGIFICHSCFQMDLGQEDWLLRYDTPDVDARIAMRAAIVLFRDDPNVASVESVQRSRNDSFWYIVRFNRGARSFSAEVLEELAGHRRVFGYEHDERSPFVEQMIAMVQETGVDINTNPGSIMRTIIDAAAYTVQQTTLTSLEQTRDTIELHLSASLGRALGVDNQLGRHDGRGLVDRIAENAWEARRPRTMQEVREQVISQYIGTPEGRSRLAMAMVNPIRRPLDYQGTARALFPIQQLPDGALPVYNEAIEALPLPAWCYPNNWVKRLRDGLVARVVEISDDRVLLQGPPIGRWNGVVEWDRMLHAKRMADAPPPTPNGDPIAFEAEWDITMPPPPPPTSWERLGNVTFG